MELDVSRGGNLRFQSLRHKLFASEGLDILFFNLLKDQGSNTKNVLTQKIQDRTELESRLDQIGTSKSHDIILYVKSVVC